MSDDKASAPSQEIQNPVYIVPFNTMSVIANLLAKTPLPFPASQERDQLIAAIGQMRPIEDPTNESTE